jgi:large exoprotein involved in heme utilization and adhesion
MGKAANGLGDIYQRGYLFSVNSNGSYSTTEGNLNGGNAFLVGAPNHFYFGVIKGESALDKFKTKYSVDE